MASKVSHIGGLLLVFCAGSFLWQTRAVAQDETTAQTSSGESKNGEAEILEAMSADPTLRDMKREGRLVELRQVYGEFVRQQQLSAQQSERFFRLLLGEDDSNGQPEDRSVNGEKSESSASANADPVRIKENEDVAGWQQVRTLLGESGYARLQGYLKGVSERLAVAQMREHLGTRNILLTDEQAITLLQILWEERAKTAPVAFDPRSPLRQMNDASIAIAGDNLERYVEVQTDLNQRVLSRASAILSPVQLRALDNFQQRHLAAEKVGWGVVRERKRRDEADAAEDEAPSP